LRSGVAEVLVRTPLALLCFFLSSTAAAQPLPVPVGLPSESQIVRDVFGSIPDSSIACAWSEGACEPGATHLSAVSGAAAPSIAACSAGTAALRQCYEGAVSTLKRSLENGDVLSFFDAGYRAREVFRRAGTESAPAWLKSAGAPNRLAVYYTSHGIDLGAIGVCRTGTPAARFRCMGSSSGPSRELFRLAIDALEEHNAILVGAGRWSGAAERALAIFESGSGPFAHDATARDVIDPKFRLGVPGIRSLAQHTFLRALTRTAADTIEEERAQSNARRFHPSIVFGGRSGLSASQLVFSAARTGDRWDEEQKTWFARNADMDHELKLSFATLLQAATLQNSRGLLEEATAMHAVFADWGAMMISPRFDRQYAASGWVAASAAFTDISVNQWNEFHDPCGFVDGGVGIEVQYIYGWIVDEDSCRQVGSWVLCTMQWGIVGWAAAGAAWYDYVRYSIRDQYRALIDSWDGTPYNYRFDAADGEMDLTYVSGETDTATILRAGVRAEFCKAELDAVGGSYSQSSAEMSCDPESTDYHGWDDECEGTLLNGGVPIGGETFIPYPIAVRICPDYVADIVGLNDTHWGGLLATCKTPYAYVDSVADYLSSEDAVFLSSAPEQMDTTIADFVMEAMLLTSPIATVQQDRADLAYIADEYVVGGCDDTTFTHCHGLDVLEERLGDAKHALDMGLVLVERFGRVGAAYGWDTTGAESIPTLSQAAVDACNTGGCEQNHTDHVRATFYRRLQEMLVMYHQVARDRFEVVWRRFDIEGGDCMAWSDTDLDGTLDTVACDATQPSCATSPECELLDTADAIVADASESMLEQTARLDEQLEYLTDDYELASFVEELSAYGDSIALDVDAQRRAFESGTDWLGFTSGRWYTTDDPSALAPSIAGDADDLSLRYREYVDAYIARTTAEAAFVADAQTLSVETESAVASFCADENGAPAPLGCGVNDTWREEGVAAGYTLIEEINDALDDLCGLTIELPNWEGDGTTIEYVGTNFLDPSDPSYTGGGNCPHLLSPNLVLWDDHTGALADRLQALENVLRDLQTLLARVDAAIVQVEANARTWEPYLDALAYEAAKAAARRHIMNAFICVGAAVGATAAWVSTFFSWGLTAPAAGAATVGAIGTCAMAFSQDVAESTDSTKSDEELALLAAQVQAELQLNRDLAAVVDLGFSVMSATFDYQTAASAFGSEKAAMERAIIMGDATTENLYTDFGALWLNPVATHFEEQEAAALRSSFRAYAQDVRRLQRAVQYEIGNALPEGDSYEVQGDEYYLPHLSELSTIASLQPFDSAFSDLRDVGNLTTLEQSGAMNLAAMAGLLLEIRTQFRSNYGKTCLGGGGCVAGDRYTSDAWIVSEESDLDERAAMGVFGNTGELALLGRSAFYAPASHGYPDAVDPNLFHYGYVDLSSYCDTWSDGVDADDIPGRDPVLEGTWFDVYSLDETTRVSFAYLDHMIRGVGVETFECHRTFSGEVVTSVSIAPAFDAATVTYEDVRGLADLVYDGDADVENTWDTRAANEEVPPRFRTAQTATVRSILDRLLTEVQTSDSVSLGHLSLLPGNYLFWIDTADPKTDVEDDLLSGLPFTIVSSQAEQLRSIALVCADEYVCDADTSAPAQLLLIGSARQGDRCELSTGAQEQVVYSMNTALVSGDHWTLTTANTSAPISPAVEEVLSDPDVIGAFGSRPLHTSGMILAVNGLRGPEPDDAAYETRWALYRDNTPAPGFHPRSRLRLRVRQSYFDTSFTSDGSSTDVAATIPCASTDATPIGD
jgi:hypothetical protein